MSAKKELTTKEFGRLTVLSDTGERTKNGEVVWMCKCSCGKQTKVGSAALLRGNTRSCGCLVLDVMRQHGLRKTHFYRKWTSIIDRCQRESQKSFKYYGGRGIKNTWTNFLSFKKDMYHTYLAHVKKHGEKNTTLDRINVDGDYSKKNCRWRTITQQANNKRNNIIILYDGKKQTISELSKKTGLSYSCLYARYKNGLLKEKVLSVSYQDD